MGKAKKISFGIIRLGWENNIYIYIYIYIHIKIDYKIGSETVKWHYMAWGLEPVGGSNEHSKKPLGSIHRGEFLV